MDDATRGLFERITEVGRGLDAAVQWLSSVQTFRDIQAQRQKAAAQQARASRSGGYFVPCTYLQDNVQTIAGDILVSRQLLEPLPMAVLQTVSDRVLLSLEAGQTRRECVQMHECSPSLVAQLDRERRSGRPVARRGGLGGRYGPLVAAILYRVPDMPRRDVARLAGCSVARVGQVANYLRDNPTDPGPLITALEAWPDEHFSLNDVREMIGLKRNPDLEDVRYTVARYEREAS